MAYRVSAISALIVLIFMVGLVVAVPSIISAQDTTKVVEVAVIGNQNINTDTIRNAVSLKPGDVFTQEAVEKDKVSVMSLGYFSAVTTRNENVAGGVKVTYEVTENSKITDVKIVGSEPVPSATVLGLMKTKPGQVLNTTTLNQDIEAVQNYYLDQGYITYVTEEIGVDPQTGVLTLPLLVHRVESVEITGNQKTKTYVFLREMKTKPGSVFNKKILNQDVIAIYNLDILEDIKNPQITAGSEVGLLKITVPVVEKKTGQVSLGFGYSSRQRLVGQARLSESNFRGKGQAVNLLIEQGTSEAVGGSSSYEIGFSEPWIDKKHTSLQVNAYNKVLYRFSSGVFNSGENIDGQSYNERHKGGDLTFSRPLTEKIRFYVGTRFENIEANPELLDVNSDANNIVQTGNLGTGSLRLVRNTRDFELDPAAGAYDGLVFQFGTFDGKKYPREGGVVVPTAFTGPFNSTSVDIRRYYSRGGRKTTPQDKRTTLAFRLRAGFASGAVPFAEQFFIGGGESLRGYREDRFWGDKMLLASVEVRKPIAQSIAGVIFMDYGDAWGGDPDYTFSGLPQTDGFEGHYGVGVGMRVVTPIGHLRLDYGIGTEGARTHFSMGQAF